MLLQALEAALTAAGYGPVAGVDEAGRGSCAGPLTAAACILPDREIPELAGLDDSKRLSPRRREELFTTITTVAVTWSVVHIPAPEIDAERVSAANYRAMVEAVAGLGITPGFVLADGFRPVGIQLPCVGCIGGDGRIRAIAAASILAKVSRDRLMVELDRDYPGYGFAVHKGYGTQAHMAAVRRHGASPVHRYSYGNVACAQAEFGRSASE